MNERERGDGITFDLMEFAEDTFWLDMEGEVQHDHEVIEYIRHRLDADPKNKELQRWAEKVARRWANLPEDKR